MLFMPTGSSGIADADSGTIGVCTISVYEWSGWQ
jgi:hypothetical protein